MIELAEIRDLLMSFPQVTEETPFGPEVLVFKVAGKMFATLGEEIEDGVPLARSNLKCDPERAVTLRDQHDAILPGYHMNKRHWNTILFDGSLPESLIADLAQHSYDLVFASLTKKAREAIRP